MLKGRLKGNDPGLIPHEWLEDSADFWSNVTLGEPDSCWPWRGQATDYGEYRGKRANRVAYFMHYEAQPGKLLVRHTCDNPPCCNPSHLILGTSKQNAADKMERGRFVHGEGKGKRKRPPLETHEIAAIKGSKKTAKFLSEQYKVSEKTIHWIRQGRLHPEVEAIHV